ncbi:VOC family protein [Halomonas campisalis]|uniref:VOC family protein n=1 Tax=Billgrantia campisalis TaxID=74661 RepID=A0ABS9P8N8_9GAMM|nr:VOC family protein [Halomonas campisalis]MCG6658119.1 VOC family protein [Halomonas campisalis]MDR5862786.1 VOC family protein [Halomonas campisalis]
MQRPAPLNGMRHIALQVQDLEACERFYVDILGMRVLRRAHEDLVYLTLGNDNFSLSRAKADTGGDPQRLDHFGFVVDTPEDVDAWHAYLQASGVEVVRGPHDHGDGGRSLYCRDPDGNSVQPLYHPSVSGQRLR